ncbi:MAG: hypothetical protein FK730_09455 [Asgard group archaeon]|nr:hypothetical protein [Asgard group archaeon]
MEEEEFKKYLRKKGKKIDVIERNCQAMKKFIAFLHEERNKDLTNVPKEDIEAYIDQIEKKNQSAKGFLYVLMNYFRFIGNKKLLNFASSLREERTQKSRRIFPIKEFLGTDNSDSELDFYIPIK